MKKLISLILLLSLLITACGGTNQGGEIDNISTLTSETTSEVTSTITSRESSNVTSQSVSVVSKPAYVEVQTYDGEIIRYYDEPIVKRPLLTPLQAGTINVDGGLKKIGKYYKFVVSFEDYDGDKIDIDLNELINMYMTYYTNYYISGLLPFDTHRGGYKLVGKDIYPVARTYMTKYHKTDKEYEEQRYEGLCLYRYAYSTFTEAVAKEVLDNPTYNGKRYHYFEKDDKTYIDQSIAKKQGYLPHEVDVEYDTYKYHLYQYSFDYDKVDDKNIDITVYIANIEVGQFEQFTMKAVLENGEWRLVEFFDFEERVTVCDPQPVE